MIVVVMGAANNDGRYGDTHRLLDFGFAEAARRDAERPLTISLDGYDMALDVAPQMVNSNAMIPLRPLFEALEWTVDWVAETSTAILAYAEYSYVRTAVGNRTIYVNHSPHILDIPAQIIDGRMFVPWQFLAYILPNQQQAVLWDEVARVVEIHNVY
jgi:hypothetical protein